MSTSKSDALSSNLNVLSFMLNPNKTAALFHCGNACSPTTRERVENKVARCSDEAN